ncbi:MAG: hypothetical protein EXR59_02900 [Dehalococcoidia bacterium]|nr:hypothetical protein [Dehalococcoidia bacterium]
MGKNYEENILQSTRLSECPAYGFPFPNDGVRTGNRSCSPRPAGPAGPSGNTTFTGINQNTAIIIGIAIGAVLFLVVVVAIVAMVKDGGHSETIVHTP